MKRPRRIYWCRRDDYQGYRLRLAHRGESTCGRNCALWDDGKCANDRRPCRYYIYEVQRRED